MKNIKSKATLIAKIFVILIAVLASWLIYKVVAYNQQEPIHEGKILSGVYTIYNNKVYVNIPFQGYYLLATADSDSFHVLSNKYINPLAEDKNAVYCGTHVIPDLQPKSSFYISKGYISDGTHTYYCSKAKKNPKHHWWHIFTRSDNYDNTNRARQRDYKIIQLNPTHTNNFKTWGQGYLSDGEQLFFEGVPIPNSNGASVQSIPTKISEYPELSPHDFYLRDNHAVYYRGKVLPQAHPNHFIAFSPVGDQWINEYGHDTFTGKFYFGAIPFPESVDRKKTTKLKMIIANRDVAHHELFINSKDVFYWDYQETKLKHACKNPFSSPDLVTEITPGILADDQKTIIVQAKELRNRNRKLTARITELIVLPNINREKWTKIEEIPKSGTLWKTEDLIWFAPNPSSSHSFAHRLRSWRGTEENFFTALYQVKNYSELRRVLKSKKELIKPSDISTYLELIDKVSKVSIVCKAKSYYSVL